MTKKTGPLIARRNDDPGRTHTLPLQKMTGLALFLVIARPGSGSGMTDRAIQNKIDRYLIQGRAAGRMKRTDAAAVAGADRPGLAGRLRLIT